MSLKKLQITSYYHFWKIVSFTWVTLFILFNVQQWQIELKVSGHIEINSGPTYVVDETVLVSFRQDDRRFGDTGIHCAHNSLHAICWSKV